MKERFEKDTAKHEMFIILEDGYHRHLQFRNPKSFDYWFDLITWPGSLCVNGDMGCFVFSRTTDMFSFFGGKEKPNLDYWSEKVVASDRGGVRQFSHDLFREKLLGCAKEYCEDWPAAEKAHFLNEIEDEIFYAMDECDKSELYKKAMDFGFNNKRPFQDFYEYNCDEFTMQFKWCCQAILWGIKQYDKVKEVVV